MNNSAGDNMSNNTTEIKLLEVKEEEISLGRALVERKSTRKFANQPMTQQQLSKVLFSAQGITHGLPGFDMRTSPSPGALYPVDIYICINDVESIPKGVYIYKPKEHKINLVKEGSFCKGLTEACMGQKQVEAAQANIIYAYVKNRIEPKYGERSVQYALIEAGASTQNVALMCAAIGLGQVIIGAFEEKKVSNLIGLKETALCIQPIGVL